MGKRYRAPTEFYAISTYYCEENKSTLCNTVYYSDKTNAIKRITELFDLCYPRGFDIKAAWKVRIESPSYNDGEVYLRKFYTLESYCYQLSILECID